MAKTANIKLSASSPAGPVGQLRQEYEAQQALFEAQPPLVQRFIEAQARQIADCFVQKLSQARFTFPDRIIVETSRRGETKLMLVPAEQREQLVGRILDRLTGSDLRVAIRIRLIELENNNNTAVAASASLMRFATAVHMIQGMLPSGRSVSYTAIEGEEIPTIPAASGMEPDSAITATTDAIAEEGQGESGALLVPFVPAARRFYLPQWVAFDDEGHLLVGAINEAEAHLASMQRFLSILHAAVFLAPYMVADELYQQKRYGMLGQTVNQGRALARYLTEEIINTIKRRAAVQDLNRGLSLSLPYFDDQDLEMKTYPFEVIPSGRIMFVPAFVVRASREEQAKVAQDTRLSLSTRKYLLRSLKMLEEAFDAGRKT